MTDIIFVGGIDGKNKWLENGKNLSRNYRQGDRVYHSDGLATTLTAQPIGGAGGNTSLYLIDESNRNSYKYMKRDGVDVMNDVIKLGYIGEDMQGYRVYDPEGIGVTISASTGGPGGKGVGLYLIREEEKLNNNKYINDNGVEIMTDIIKYDIAMPVRVRKHEVDIEGLKELLRSHKKLSKLTNRNIAEKFNKPVTEIEHWFRTDNCFSIPDSNIWYALKELLGITTDVFDLPVTEFVEQPGVYEKANRFYDTEGIAPTLTATSADEKILYQEGECVGSKVFNEVEYRDKINFTYYSLFAGIGGISMGLEPLGGKCLGAWEYDPTEKRQFAQEAHKLLHPHISIHGDVTEIIPKELEDFDVLAFTPPCQSFSQAGLKKGFEDTRGTLTFDALQVAKVKQPKILLMENVKGMLNHDKGNTMSVICHAINEIGYYVDFTILNSKFFDVAQNRERLYLVAVRKDLIVQQEWNIEKGTTILHKVKRKLKEEGIHTYNFDWPKQTEVRTRLRDFLEHTVDERYYLSDDKTATLVAQLKANDYRYSKVEDVTFINPRKVDGSQTLQQDRTYTTDGCMTTIQAQLGGRFNVVEDNPIVIDVSQMRGDANNIRTYEGVAPTITARDYKEPRMVGQFETQEENVIQPNLTEEVRSCLTPELVATTGEYPKYRIRRLTTRECLRLQATPEHYIDLLLENFSSSRCYRFAGNGLTINVIRTLGEKIITYLNK